MASFWVPLSYAWKVVCAPAINRREAVRTSPTPAGLSPEKLMDSPDGGAHIAAIRKPWTS